MRALLLLVLAGCAVTRTASHPLEPCAVDPPLVVVVERQDNANWVQEPAPRARSRSLGMIGDEPLSGGVTRDSPTVRSTTPSWLDRLPRTGSSRGYTSGIDLSGHYPRSRRR
jgi:hypothetical protein